MLDYCALYQKKTGNFPYQEQGPWGAWFHEQRQALKEGNLSEDKANAIKAAGYKSQEEYFSQKKDETLKKQLESLSKYQAKNGRGKYPTDGKANRTLAVYINSTLIPRYLQGNLPEEDCRKLYEDYGLEMFNPNKLEQIEEVNKLGSGEIKKLCKKNKVPLTNSAKSRGHAKLEILRNRLLQHMFRLEVSAVLQVHLNMISSPDI